MTEVKFSHAPVLINELIESLNIGDDPCVIDCTTGGGGHLAVAMERSTSRGTFIGIDRDPDAIAHLEAKFSVAISDGRLRLVKAKFSSVAAVAKELGIYGKVTALYADLGVSSHQLDSAHRGFSFSNPGPLDMRMSYDSDLASASTLLKNKSESELADIFFYYGEIRESRRLARKIVERRQAEGSFSTTDDLVDVSCAVLGPKRFGHSHPATRVFQALRIAVNEELDEVKTLLKEGLGLLRPAGRFSVIAFHSLEDRLVKQKFSELAGRNPQEDLPREILAMQKPVVPQARIIKPFPLSPSESEVSENPRSRSAKLRVIEKMEISGANNV